mmetsp:Transcript_39111/g.91073  ORF Transcript_39111/g.91073 Transcript_39111/m.91073 type:complete len:93 (-) Transcript_39111:399-677(-)
MPPLAAPRQTKDNRPRRPRRATTELEDGGNEEGGEARDGREEEEEWEGEDGRDGRGGGKEERLDGPHDGASSEGATLSSFGFSFFYPLLPPP